MAKKDGFNFDTESKFSFKTGSGKSLTKKQKETLLIVIIALVVVAVIAAVGILLAIVGNDNGSGGNNWGGGNNEDDITVGEENVTGIIISTAPYKNYYYVGDLPNYEGLVIGIQGINISREFLDYEDYSNEFTITGFDSSAPVEKQEITVEYKGFSDTFFIEVLEVPLSAPTLQSIRLDPAPKDTCKIGKSPSLKDARIVCTYNDGSEQSVKLDYKHLYNYEDALIAAQIGDVVTITVRYSENGILAETSYTVTMIE